MNSVDVAWVAGIIEGEGCMGLDNMGPKSKNLSPKAYIKVAMTDYDVIQALHQKTGVGNIHGPYPGGGSSGPDYWKEQWVWHVGKREDVRLIITAILPFLYERRTLQAMTCLDVIEQRDQESLHRKNFCPKNHKKPDCLEPDGRHCRICRTEKYAIRKNGGSLNGNQS